ncbi:MAG: hypothetical protein QGH20_01095, partial [Candidatus Latescibacteria bacterium]|nr:hypothetical protein [Candidatus Latescibacterota bacterium]
MRNLFCLGAVLAMVLAGSLGAQDLESRVVERTLPNGLRYLFVERQGAPIFSARLYVKVGGVDDPQGNIACEASPFQSATQLGSAPRSAGEESKRCGSRLGDGGAVFKLGREFFGPRHSGCQSQ